MLAIFDISFAQLGNVFVNSDATGDSLDSMPSIQARGHFRNVFIAKPSEILLFLVIFPQRLTKENFWVNLLRNGLFQCLVAFKWLKKNYRIFCSFDLYTGKDNSSLIPQLADVQFLENCKLITSQPE